MDKKIEDYIKEVDRRVDNNFALAPPLFRILWWCGLRIRPPLFQTFMFNFLVNGIIVIVITYCLIPLLHPILPVVPDNSLLGTTGLAVFFGICMGWYSAKWYEKEARNAALPKWEDYNPPHFY